MVESEKEQEEHRTSRDPCGGRRMEGKPVHRLSSQSQGLGSGADREMQRDTNMSESGIAGILMSLREMGDWKGKVIQGRNEADLRCTPLSTRTWIQSVKQLLRSGHCNFHSPTLSRR